MSFLNVGSMTTMFLASGKGKGCSRIPSTQLKMAPFSPMPMARHSMAVAVKPSLVKRVLTLYRMSCQTISSLYGRPHRRVRDWPPVNAAREDSVQVGRGVISHDQACNLLLCFGAGGTFVAGGGPAAASIGGRRVVPAGWRKRSARSRLRGTDLHDDRRRAADGRR